MTDRDDEQWLRDGLASAVPEPPTHPDRARAAESLARRQRRTTAAVAGAMASVVVIAGLSAALSLGGGSDPDRAPADDPTGTDTQVQCPPVVKRPSTDGFFDEPDPDLPGEVPPGATSVRICAGNGNRLDVPADALEGASGVEQLTDAVNDLPVPDGDLGCTDELGYGYRLVFDYPDEPDFLVSGALYGCQFVTFGSEQRPGADDLLQTFGDLLREERATRPALEWEPPPLSTLPCDEPTTPAVARPEDVEIAVFCVRTNDGFRIAEVSDQDLEVLRSDLLRNVDNYAWPDCITQPETALVGLTRWGEGVTLSSVCLLSQYAVQAPWGTSDWGLSWRPGDEAHAILGRLVEGAEAEPPSGSVAGCPRRSWDYASVDLEDERLMAAPDLVPEGAVSARLCTDSPIGPAPAERLTRDVDALVDAINDLPRQRHGACTDEGPVGYRLVFGYPDGTSFVAAGWFTGCGYNVVGSGYRSDPEVPLDTFIELLRAQREASLPPALVVEPEDLDCSFAGDLRTAALADPTEMLTAKLCIGDAGLAIPNKDLPTLVDDYRTHQGPVSGGSCRAVSTRIVGVTRWGDQFSLTSECGTESYLLPGSVDEPRYWNPGDEVQQLLEELAAAD